MRVIFLLVVLMLTACAAPPPVNYKVIPIDGREVIVNCLEGTHPQVNTIFDNDDVVDVHCVEGN